MPDIPEEVQPVSVQQIRLVLNTPEPKNGHARAAAALESLPAVVSETENHWDERTPASDLPFNVDLLPALIVDALLPAPPSRNSQIAQPVIVFRPIEFPHRAVVDRAKASAPAPAIEPQSQAADSNDLLEELRQKLQTGSGDTRATLHAIGKLLLEQKRYDEAMPVFEKWIALEPGDPAAQTGLGKCLERQGRWGEAAARFRMALDADPDLTAAISGIGYCMLRLDDTTLALNQFERCLAVAPTYIPALVGKAVCLQLTGNRPEADAIYAGVLRRDPSMHSALSPLMENPPKSLTPASIPLVVEEAGAAREPAEFDSPDSYHTWFNLGVAEQYQGRHEASVAAFRSAARLCPDNAEAWQALAMALHNRGDVEGAKGAYAAALDVSPELPVSLWNYGLLLEKTGKLQEAGEVFSRLVQADPGRQDVWFRLATVLARSGDYEGAVAACRKCPELIREGQDVHVSLGMACWNQGDIQGAAGCFTEMLARDPKSARALRAAAAAAIRLEDYVRALELNRRMNECGDASFEALCNRAGLETRAGSLTAAVAYFRQAATAYPESEEASIGLAMARRALLERPGF